jgi:hypothetical protein
MIQILFLVFLPSILLSMEADPSHALMPYEKYDKVVLLKQLDLVMDVMHQIENREDKKDQVKRLNVAVADEFKKLREWQESNPVETLTLNIIKSSNGVFLDRTAPALHCLVNRIGLVWECGQLNQPQINTFTHFIEQYRIYLAIGFGGSCPRLLRPSLNACTFLSNIWKAIVPTYVDALEMLEKTTDKKAQTERALQVKQLRLAIVEGVYTRLISSSEKTDNILASALAAKRDGGWTWNGESPFDYHVGKLLEKEDKSLHQKIERLLRKKTLPLCDETIAELIESSFRDLSVGMKALRQTVL